MISKFQVGLNSLLRQGLSEPDFYGDLVYKLKKIVGSNDFSAQFIKIISHYKKIGYNINVLQQIACLVVNPITVGNLSIDGLVEAWCFGCLSGPPGFTCWLSFAPVFSFIYCWVLIFALNLVISWFICSRRWCIDKLGVFHANQTSMCLDPHLN